MDTKKKRIQDTIAELLEEADAKQESKTTRMAMKTLGVALLKKLNEVIKTVQSNKVVFPSKTNVTVTNAKDFPKPVVNVPSEVSLRQVAWLQNAFESIKDEVKKITGQALKFPKTAKDAIPVRLSDGEEFYKAVADVVVQGGGMSGGGGSVPKITLDGGIQAVPVVNPDGTNIAGGEGGGSGVAAYSDSSDTDKKGLVDADRHVQVDVLTAPTTTVQATNLDIRDLTNTDVVTAELSAVDNAVLDTIDAVLDTIKTDTEAIETAVEAIQSGQLADGHNVTIDNSTGASAVNIQDGGNTITVDGTVTANLSGTDNTVLDNIDSDTSNIQTAVQLIDDAIVADDAAFTPATTKVMMSGFEFDDTSPDTVNEGDAGAARMSSRREVYVQLRDAAGNERGLNIDASGRITTNATQGGTWNIGTVTAVTAISNALPAGTNAIGKLAANSGVDIGDVDVTSLPRSQSGPGQPGTAIDSYTSDDVNLAANTANQSVIAAPGASKQIWVYGLVGTVDVAGSISIQDEDDAALSGVMPVGITGGFVMNPSGNFSMPWIKVATNKALEIDTVTCTFDGIITYAIVSV